MSGERSSVGAVVEMRMVTDGGSDTTVVDVDMTGWVGEARCPSRGVLNRFIEGVASKFCEVIA